MLNPLPHLSASLLDIRDGVASADRSIEEMSMGINEEWAEPQAAWQIECAFVKLLALTEALQLPLLRADVLSTMNVARNDGFSSASMAPDGDVYSKWGSPIRQFLEGLEATFLPLSERTITKDLESILRACTYSITDEAVFSGPPLNEGDVHLRIEAVLRCVFPDLRHTPPLSKPIKNFFPDTGLPSLQTLIEYKYLADKASVSRIADELLADTRGYTSKDWHSFLYVLYETRRLRPEAEWRLFLRECDVPSNTTVVVLTGEPPKAPTRKRNKAAP